ncbi:Epithelial splicing regulatory protein 2 [Trichinella britovi]|uniref:Epithelial splicing regulatory protein 2 n=2 Tax=Trichinella TaxID=6333 RepID=A0A0V1CNP4_TRIBR|nr:Epithelial splicing regulatory protein 2 [Trichinella murrelli]KRX56668.1 Epithelial splicing regulatory protein 2 [Trichinella sp. T9]KRY50759.1 Epithelial splicing regulatory protein 2 [Trichinella britovi]
MIMMSKIADQDRDQRRRRRFLIGLNVATYGLDGEYLGSDEAEIVYFAFVVYDCQQDKLMDTLESFVQPVDLNKVNWEHLKKRLVDENEVKNANKLADVIAQLESKLLDALKLDNGGGGVGGDSFLKNAIFVTYGQTPLRQCLHPEAANKGINLSEPYWQFCDLSKEYCQVFNNSQPVNSLKEIFNESCSDDENEYSFQSITADISKAIVHLVKEASKRNVSCFCEPELVKAVLENGICTRQDVVESSTVIRARGLPWQSSDQDVARFFVGLNIARGGVALCLSPQGRRNGEALVRFENAEHRELALKRHRHFMGSRYIEVYRSTGEDFLNIAAEFLFCLFWKICNISFHNKRNFNIELVVAGNSNEAQQFLSRECVAIIRMRGLPYDCTAKRIMEFFESGENGVKVAGGESGIMFVNKADGRATGDAFVLIASEEDAQKALSKHKEVIGSRYIELFRSTSAEVQQVINKSLEVAKIDLNTMPTVGLLGSLPPRGAIPTPVPGQIQPILPPQAFITGCRKDCVRLRGLPYEAEVQHILEFLGEFSKHIVLQGVHMVYNAQGNPSGEAFIQMDSDIAAATTAADRHNKYMHTGKKQRYIEVFQCSADDMNLVLAGPAPVPSPLMPSAAAAIAANQARPTLPSPGNSVLSNPAVTTALFSGSFAGYPFLGPQILHGGTSLGLQNGAWAAAAAAAASGTLPYILNAAPRLPMISGVPGLLPALTATPGTVFYWPYPSPPVSPTNYFASPGQANQPPTPVLLRGLPFNVTPTDVLSFFQGFPEITMDCIHLQRAPNGQLNGEAIILFQSRMEAERAVIECSRQLFGNRPIEMFICTL